MLKEIRRRNHSQQAPELLSENGSFAPFGNLLHVPINDHRHCCRLVVLLDFSPVLLVDGFLEVPGRSVDVLSLTCNL